ncbi:MAG: hypothetical protein LBR53_12635, partial [Deltaproteobacteria bacterium]|nr:hypothetical protein [Deltaproteobacteria bacterium]
IHILKRGFTPNIQRRAQCVSCARWDPWEGASVRVSPIPTEKSDVNRKIEKIYNIWTIAVE